MTDCPVSEQGGAAPPAPQPFDRRKTPRMRCTGIAKVVVLRLGKRLCGTLLDLSVSGCCIAMEAALPETADPRVEVQIAVEGSRLRVAGVVRNVRRGQRVGIEFIEVGTRKAEQIRLVIAELRERRPFAREWQTGRVAARRRAEQG